jgi:RHS repeat-associated protein
MPHLHLKRIHTNTAKIPKVSLFNVVNGAFVRPLRMVNSQKQRLTALFFVVAMVASLALSIAASTDKALAAGKKTPQPLAVASQKAAEVNGAIGKGTTLGSNPPSPTTKQSAPTKQAEIVSERTENSESFDLGNGQKTVKKYFDRVNYQKNGKWEKIDNTLVEDTNAADSTNVVGKAIAFVKGKTQKLDTYKLAANDWQARFAKSDDKVGMIRIESGNTKLAYFPVGASKSVTPVVTTEDGKQTVTYKDLWNGVDLRYTVKGGALKEDIIIKTANATTSYAFKVTGANLKKNASGGFDVEGTEQQLAPLSVTLQTQGPISETKATQEYKNGVLTVTLDGGWLKQQKTADFPIIIDPSWRRSSNVSWNYTAYKSDGYVCSSSSCYMNAGYLSNNGWKGWRTVFWVSMPELPGKQILSANLIINKRSGIGTTEGLYTEVSRAACWGYNCIDWGSPRHSAWFGTNGNISMTALLQRQADIGDTGPTYILNGEERAYLTWKGFDADNSWIEYTFNSTPSVPTPLSPADKQVVVTDQPMLQVNPSTDPDGDPIQYYFRVSTGQDGETGTVINSGLISSTQWTVPEGVLQDGVTYYWHVYSHDSCGQYVGGTCDRWGSPINVWTRSFKYDARLGNDSAASFDDGGPVDVNLATGNVVTSAGTHTMSALGGNIGLSFDYNSPYRSKPGLTAEYYNNTSWSGSSAIRRIETNLNFPWNTGTPAAGVVNNDNFSMRLKGYFIAPKSGNYQFGFTADDYYALYLNNESTPAVSAGCCSNGNWTMGSRYFSEGQIVPMQMDYIEATGNGYLYVAVRIDGVEQQIQTNWLRTEPKTVSQNNGLMGRYFSASAGVSPTFPTDPMSSFLTRRETNMNFNWGEGSPMPYGPINNFAARYTGYFTAPVTGTYYFGTSSDDGSRIYLNGGTSAYQDDWKDTGSGIGYGPAVNLTSGQSIPITAEFYENLGAASFGLYVKGAVAEQIIPSAWLSTKINPLPNGWQMSVDADGDLAYDYANIQTQSVILYDAEGDQHEYKWNGSAYTPPVNEYGFLTKNADSTYTLIDSDGRTYTFNSAGQLTSTSTPNDDRKPTALIYGYDGTPARLTTIKDGADQTRMGTLYYSGDNNCGSVPNGYDSQPPFNMLCAFKTTDQQLSYLYYKNGQLARIVSPGGVTTTLGYDALGRLVQQQSSLAYDAVAAGIRQDNSTVTSQIDYDVVGRANSITLPSATEGGFRAKHNYNYLNNATQTNEVGEVEPKGYSQRVEYDSLYRTVKNYGKDGNATQQEWDAVKDLLLSSTDATGLKSTTIYDANDLPIDNYGPAPSVWFGTDRKPLATYTNQVPHTQTNYDEGINGLAVSWFNYVVTKDGGSLVGAPKYHTTGITPNKDRSWLGRDFRLDSVPFTPDNQTANAASLLVGGTLGTNQSIWSEDGQFRLIMQTDGNLVIYGPSGVVWASNTSGANCRLVLQGDGNLVIYNGNNVATWASATSGRPSGSLVMQNDGNLVIFGNDNSAIWATNIVKNPDAKYYGYGFRATGTVTFPQSGTYTYNIWNDDGARLTVNDNVLINNLGTRSEGVTQKRQTATFTAEAGKPYRIELAYGHTGYNQGALELWLSGPGITDTNAGLGTSRPTFVKPVYALTTSSKVFDSQTGDSTTKTDYGAQPELAQAKSVTEDVGGLNLTTSYTYEPYQAGSLMRQTSKTMPGGNTYTYLYYGATEVRKNECDANSSPVSQAGFAKGKIEPDPDGVGPQTPRTSETIYDSTGRVVATKFNNDPWTCTNYDARGRVISTVIPDINGRAGRTISSNYAVNGNPLVTSTTDQNGSIIVETDLLGRVISYKDTHSNVTTSAYDNAGHLVSRASPLGTETYTYDDYDRLVSQSLNSVVLATVTYDTFSRIASVAYPTANQQKLGSITRDNLGRMNGLSYTLGDGSTIISDQVNRTVSGDVISGTENGLAKSYTYDGGGRLTAATIGTNSYSYGFGTATAAQCAQTSANLNAGKNGNRTTQTINGKTTNYCYDSADRLLAGSDPSLAVVDYDDHGNTTAIGTSNLPVRFAYDASDRNTGVVQYTSDTGNGIATYYTRDVQGRIMGRYINSIANFTWSAAGDSFYGFTGSGDTPDFIRDNAWNVVEKYVTLPGNVLVTIRPNASDPSAQMTFSLPNIHGDNFAMTKADGSLLSTNVTGPFGELIDGQLAPTNADRGASYSYIGQHQKLSESNFSIPVVQMGARVYLASIGRFAQVDPIEGGTDNAYAYVNNPITDYDLTGQRAQRGRQQAQEKKLNFKELKAWNEGKNKYNSKDWNSAKAKQKYNEKIRGERQSRESKDKNNRKGPPSLPSGGLPSVSPQAKKAAGGTAAAASVLIAIWWGAKVLSPGCLVAAPVCAVVL